MTLPPANFLSTKLSAALESEGNSRFSWEPGGDGGIIALPFSREEACHEIPNVRPELTSI